MFGFALLASCRPCHEDWLNERSSTPPVSSTMHSFAEPVDAAVGLPDAALELDGAVLGAVEADVDEVGVVLDEELAELFGLLLHAVNASATTPMTAMPCTVFFTTPPVSFRC